MEVKTVTQRVETIVENTTLNPDGFGGWLAMNIGTGDVEVDGFVLKPNQQLDYSHLLPNIQWGTPIVIVCKDGGILRLARMQYL